MFERLRKHRIKLGIFSGLIFIVIMSGFYGRFRPLPKGISYESEWCHVEELQFLRDLTYEADGEHRQEQEIFANVFRVIGEAERFLVVDMFLFNDEYDRSFDFPSLSVTLANRLAVKKHQHPEMEIRVITDPINTFYGAYPSKCVDILSNAGIPVVYTDLDRLRNSNGIYSSIYAPFLSHFGTSGKGWIANPFSPDSPKVTLRAFLKMLNFKANHRKVIVSEKEAMVCSSNPHDASFHHSNIAFSAKGEILNWILQAELSVLAFSDQPIELPDTVADDTAIPSTEAKLVTEGKIREEWLGILNRVGAGDSIDIAMFYIAERSIVNAIKKAAQRGAKVRLILDANKDAFGRQKNGIPNRQVASELVNTKGANIQIRWYSTHGEQFHTKLMIANLKTEGRFYATGGSANLTRRNIGDYNLESDLCVRTPLDSDLRTEMNDYFERLWSNRDGQFTLDYDAYRDDSRIKQWIYRFQEFTGLCTF